MFVVFACLFIFGTFSIHALDSSGIEGQAQGVQEGVAKTQEQIDEIKTTFLGEQWRELFLRNRVISSVDSFFHKINVVFVILFARSYSFSLEMFFAFLIWLFTFLWMPKMAGVFVNGKGIKYLIGLLATIVVAQLQVFNELSKVMVKIMFYRTSTAWSVAMFIFLVVALFAYLVVSNIIAKAMKKAKEEREKRKQEHEIKILKERDKGINKGLG